MVPPPATARRPSSTCTTQLYEQKRLAYSLQEPIITAKHSSCLHVALGSSPACPGRRLECPPGSAASCPHVSVGDSERFCTALHSPTRAWTPVQGTVIWASASAGGSGHACVAARSPACCHHLHRVKHKIWPWQSCRGAVVCLQSFSMLLHCLTTFPLMPAQGASLQQCRNGTALPPWLSSLVCCLDACMV